MWHSYLNRSTRPHTHKPEKINWRDALWGYTLIAPALFFISVFTLLPVLLAFGISFTDWNLINPPNFVQLENYKQIFSDPVALQALVNTFAFTFSSVPISIALSLGLAVLLNQKIRGLTLFRTAYYLPVVSSTVAIAMASLWIFDANYGLMNRFLTFLGFPAIHWLTDPKYALLAIIIVAVWRSLGFNMIIFLAALQGVSDELHEAAAIDGAANLQRFFFITIPLIMPAIFFASVTGFVSSFQSFDLIYNMRGPTNSAPLRATYVVGYYIYQQGFKYLYMGYGTAIAFVLFAIIVGFTLVQWRLNRRTFLGEEQ